MSLRNFFQIITRHSRKIHNPLGRWTPSKNNRETEIKILMANHDNCGGDECGCPSTLKNHMDTINEKQDSEQTEIRS